ncbi:dihydroorotase [Candidatus Falkowbacteria bacterium CG_4_9_14_3_um_filter_36_9]|uniref:Uncharacterized protein n=2 Tax=Candidatus Falkowiibacteriota TaxID=1752728 RepID=A0A1J4T652_9BACT|nr:MAG: hypothetical protein AUJ27_02230 [Candidatus Falkowbacteria bacterium CG1_02_37_44]PIV51067.1 MAG: dihydroorotase [Candidatus Falkowbacteria bacterium CG02_land_8_20_14_3_00_36_14]PIX11087.1 MAG: dihydroorotase [Candidatus Falkowbacteria bacterium CG_4_8_14_3_um_filter_36_11]PJA11214.1 MAG: dihydroorotase [Candidatus Falkowbacteria bacterium CG_4_10_14_0_2_um_filter_36_22]PJB20721.1 MAG: dihydroorotase [Candidatus Falkowbacteria bacterium CG_4_9_14_3_um_filter_36_9]
MTNIIKILKPFDSHTHLRIGQKLEDLLCYYNNFAWVVAMGNLPEPVITGPDMIHYSTAIRGLRPQFKIILPIMLVRNTTPGTIQEAWMAHCQSVKMIPEDTSTEASQGISLYDLKKYYPDFEKMDEKKMLFSGHWELAKTKTGLSIPLVEREEESIPFLEKLVKDFPNLIFIIEHATTRSMIEFVKKHDNVFATLTPHHAILTTEDVLDKNGKIYNPLNFCLPVAKSEDDRRAVIEAMISEETWRDKFSYGSDSAPHSLGDKLNENPRPGLFTAPTGKETIVEIFDKNNALDYRLEEFLSIRGHNIYGKNLLQKTITFIRESWIAPKIIKSIPVFRGGEEISFKVINK